MWEDRTVWVWRACSLPVSVSLASTNSHCRTKEGGVGSLPTCASCGRDAYAAVGLSSVERGGHVVLGLAVPNEMHQLHLAQVHALARRALHGLPHCRNSPPEFKSPATETEPPIDSDDRRSGRRNSCPIPFRSACVLCLRWEARG